MSAASYAIIQIKSYYSQVGKQPTAPPDALGKEFVSGQQDFPSACSGVQALAAYAVQYQRAIQVRDCMCSLSISVCGDWCVGAHGGAGPQGDGVCVHVACVAV